MIDIIRAVSGAVIALALGSGLAAADTLATVKQRGSLICGVSTGLIGFSERAADGKWSGFDVDFCRALAAATLGSPDKVAFVPVSASERFEALSQRRIDVLSRNTTWTLQREAEFGFLFAGINFHDGQGFMVHRDSNITSALEIGDRTTCAQAGTSGEALASDFFRENNVSAKLRVLPDAASTLAAFARKDCEVMTTDQSGLYAERLKLERPASAIILPDVISKEPLGPVTRADDVRWHMVVKWVNFALISAEELGITSQNVREARTSAKPDVRRFVGAEGGLGSRLGLADDWAAQAVLAVGNYSEIYERNVGTRSRLGIPRGLNQLWSQGGILYAPPVR